ncbi:hypothetical protein BJV77DRAFT_530101 [Russula vinacea]|nr:hypothetical protein BJV77DRAFT_530101 [Russula vinacea]
MALRFVGEVRVWNTGNDTPRISDMYPTPKRLKHMPCKLIGGTGDSFLYRKVMLRDIQNESGNVEQWHGCTLVPVRTYPRNECTCVARVKGSRNY